MFGLPVTIENDANCAGLAESQFGIEKDSKKINLLHSWDRYWWCGLP